MDKLVRSIEKNQDYRTKAIKVIWDCDGENCDLPEVVNVPLYLKEDEIADWLSDEYCFCVESYYYV